MLPASIRARYRLALLTAALLVLTWLLVMIGGQVVPRLSDRQSS